MSGSFEDRVSFYEKLLGDSDLAVFVACVEEKAPSGVVSVVLNAAMGAAIKERLRGSNFEKEFLVDSSVADAMLEAMRTYGFLDRSECWMLFNKLSNAMFVNIR